MNDMMNPRRRRDRYSQGSKGEESENPFFDGDSSSSDEQPDLPRQNQKEDNRQVFEFKDVHANKKVSLIATRLRGRASAWWQQLKLTREMVGKPRVTSCMKMKKLLRENTIPHNYQWLMYQRLQNVKQGTKSIEDYTAKIYQLIERNDIHKTNDQLVSLYIAGLRVRSSSSPSITGGSSSSGNCKKAGKRHLFIDEEWEDNGVVDDDYEEPPVLDDGQYEEEIMSGDVGVNLMVRRSC
ncbi:putative reverse transcriptase domain-containing protein [Tanacetum coccineum]